MPSPRKGEGYDSAELRTTKFTRPPWCPLSRFRKEDGLCQDIGHNSASFICFHIYFLCISLCVLLFQICVLLCVHVYVDKYLVVGSTCVKIWLNPVPTIPVLSMLHKINERKETNCILCHVSLHSS